MSSTINIHWITVTVAGAVSHGGHTVSAVSCSTVLSEVIFLLEVIQLGHNSEKSPRIWASSF